jgi:hypothetical protein
MKTKEVKKDRQTDGHDKRKVEPRYTKQVRCKDTVIP